MIICWYFANHVSQVKIQDEFVPFCTAAESSSGEFGKDTAPKLALLKLGWLQKRAEGLGEKKQERKAHLDVSSELDQLLL